eukprot:m.78238 g.78238  ORF g.78238 m.78238 type:complete len:474 (-) comp14103_c0_seq1:2563-3984(-)
MEGAAPMLVDVHGTDIDSRVQAILEIVVDQKTENEAFFLTDIGDVYRKHLRWQQHLPNVEPFYAVKCNSDPVILRALTSLNVNFDCASMAEIQKILDLGVTADRIIFANPCKAVAHLHFAKKVGVKMMTFDNEYELMKIAKYYPEAELVLRVLADDSRSVCRLGLKFGADPATTPELLSAAKNLGLNIIGVSFHVGSGASDACAFSDAVGRARMVFDQAIELGFQPTLLDVGGGFPGSVHSAVTFEDIAAELNRAFEEHFPPSTGVRIIAEPGRYYVASASSLSVIVTSKRRVKAESGRDSGLAQVLASTSSENAEDGAHHQQGEESSEEPSSPSSPSPATKFMYYVNDGVYGSFNCILFDHVDVYPEVLYMNNGVAVDYSSLPTFESSLWGPTCDSMDCVKRSAFLPEMEVGDWIVFHNMGAYTSCAASTFNGFALSRHIYTFTRDAELHDEGHPLAQSVALVQSAITAPVS